jgi:hypothetical protein
MDSNGVITIPHNAMAKNHRNQTDVVWQQTATPIT